MFFFDLDSKGSTKLVADFSSTFFTPSELNNLNVEQFSSPEVYRLSHLPLIDPNSEELVEAYHKATYVGSTDMYVDIAAAGTTSSSQRYAPPEELGADHAVTAR